MKPRILAIDDSRTMRELLRLSLEEAGFEVETAEDGIDGVERFAQMDADAVITDINMPRKDGFGVIEDIRAGSVNQMVPILVLTTESGPELKDRARRSGATGWIVKPFDDVSLVNVLRRVTGATA